MEILTVVMVYYLIYYHIGRRLAINFAHSFGGAKIFGIISVIVFAITIVIGEKFITESGIKFIYVFIFTLVLTISTIYFHIKSK